MKNSEFQSAVRALSDATEAFSRGDIKSVQYNDLREKAISQALIAMAVECGIALKEPLHINSLGEFNFQVLHSDGRDTSLGCGKFGLEFATYLNRFGVRTGAIEYGYSPCMRSDDGWCHMNHFQAEKMILDRMNRHQMRVRSLMRT
jgi:hypothetical protein